MMQDAVAKNRARTAARRQVHDADMAAFGTLCAALDAAATLPEPERIAAEIAAHEVYTAEYNRIRDTQGAE